MSCYSKNRAPQEIAPPSNQGPIGTASSHEHSSGCWLQRPFPGKRHILLCFGRHGLIRFHSACFALRRAILPESEAAQFDTVVSRFLMLRSRLLLRLVKRRRPESCERHWVKDLHTWRPQQRFDSTFEERTSHVELIDGWGDRPANPTGANSCC